MEQLERLWLDVAALPKTTRFYAVHNVVLTYLVRSCALDVLHNLFEQRVRLICNADIL